MEEREICNYIINFLSSEDLKSLLEISEEKLIEIKKIMDNKKKEC